MNKINVVNEPRKFKIIQYVFFMFIIITTLTSLGFYDGLIPPKENNGIDSPASFGEHREKNANCNSDKACPGPFLLYSLIDPNLPTFKTKDFSTSNRK